MKLSIITVCYNSAATIRDAVDSVLEQEGVELEYIVIDGQSSDETVDVLKTYGERVTHLVSEPDHGIYDAMNKGVALATGDVVGILNSDDFYADASVLSEVVTAFEGNREPGTRHTAPPSHDGGHEGKQPSTINHRSSTAHVDCVYGDLDYVDAEDTDRVVRAWRSGELTHRAFRRGWHPAHPTFFVRRSVYERVGTFNLDLKIAADYEFMLRVLERDQAKAAYLPRVLVKMRTGGASNASIKNILQANLQCWQAWRLNGLGWSPLPILAKPLSKLKQFWTKR
jgi:glycosyltransferase involved in cell wall biosynthesis